MIIIFHPTYSSSGSSVVGAHPASSGHRQDSTLDRVPLHHGVIHTPTLLKWGQCRQASHLYRKSLECGRNPEKTHADRGRCANSTHSGPNWEFIFFLINVILKRP